MTPEAMFGPAWDPMSTTFVSCTVCGAAVANTAAETELHYHFHTANATDDEVPQPQ